MHSGIVKVKERVFFCFYLVRGSTPRYTKYVKKVFIGAAAKGRSGGETNLVVRRKNNNIILCNECMDICVASVCRTFIYEERFFFGRDGTHARGKEGPLILCGNYNTFDLL